MPKLQSPEFLVSTGSETIPAGSEDELRLVILKAIQGGASPDSLSVYHRIQVYAEVKITTGNGRGLPAGAQLAPQRGRPRGSRTRTVNLREQIQKALGKLGGEAQLTDVAKQLMKPGENWRSLYSAVGQVVKRYPEFRSGPARGQVQLDASKILS